MKQYDMELQKVSVIFLTLIKWLFIRENNNVFWSSIKKIDKQNVYTAITQLHKDPFPSVLV